MTGLIEKKYCTGCQACANACPQYSISMECDVEGFWYPTVNREGCVDCGLCERVCPILHRTEHSHSPVAYAAYSKNLAVRMSSSSGGLFSLLAEHILDDGGIVFGAAFDERFNVVHTAVENKEDLFKIRGSKYVQSRIGDTYRQAGDCLQDGRPVLFTGTPCQISGLKAYLTKEYANLLTQDIICHGVPSPKVWGKYLSCRIKREGNGSSLVGVSFRSKKEGWKHYSIELSFANGKVYERFRREDTYMRAFLSDICLRPSCYSCRFKTLVRDSDITLADYWGVQAQHPEMDDDRGTSLVMIHSLKGETIFAELKDKIHYKEVDVRTAISENQAAVKAPIGNPQRDKFFSDMGSREFDGLIKKYCKDKLSVKRIVRTALMRLGLLDTVREILGR